MRVGGAVSDKYIEAQRELFLAWVASSGRYAGMLDNDLVKEALLDDFSIWLAAIAANIKG